MGAGLQQNMGKEWGPRVWSKMTKSSPNPVFVDAARSAKKAEKDRKRKATDEAKEQQRSKWSRIDNTVAACKAYSRNDGIVPNDVADDVSPESLDTRFYEMEVVITQVDAEGLERRTQKQAERNGRVRGETTDFI